ncbi:MAG: PIN/TRAM domain-containing protein [Pirellulales bacterium]|nr:PIN/TRAM domain-containing protein [Pirellulales bacterium]
MALLILRVIFVLVASALGVSVLRSGLLPVDNDLVMWLGVLGMIGAALAIIAADILVRRKHLDVISSIYFGMIVGLLLAYVASLALEPLFPTADELKPAFATLELAQQRANEIRAHVQLILAAVTCYICISLLMQTRHDFRFIIPYVEFSKEAKGRRPFVLDTSVVIDGRIADLIETNLFDSQLVMPRFAIAELQSIADNSDRLRRSRGRRGLDVLNRLRNQPEVDLVIFDRDLPEFAGQPVDMKLVLLAKHLEGKLITNDYNLNKVARVHGVGVINLNDMANALKPVFLPGEQINVRVVKQGEEPGQGVGYLDDGTMVVIESGRDHVGHDVRIAVTSVLQTSAGRMVFGRFEEAV